VPRTLLEQTGLLPSLAQCGLALIEAGNVRVANAKLVPFKVREAQGRPRPRRWQRWHCCRPILKALCTDQRTSKQL
jgi:hypothetical protein